VAISRQMDTCPVTQLPFKDHLSMSDRPEKKIPGKTDQ